jgi:LemA protein
MRGRTGMIVVLALLVGAGLMAITTYNGLVGLDQQVKSQAAQVENAYQRRADLVPNLVATVKGAASFEKETLTAVTEARARVGQVSGQSLADLARDPAALQRYQQAQDGLSSALSRLLVVSERYPDLKATQAFRDLQVQLEGTENRVAVERMRYNDAARAFNTRRAKFPAVIFAGLFGGRFAEKAYFQAQAGAQTAPKVQF